MHTGGSLRSIPATLSAALFFQLAAQLHTRNRSLSSPTRLTLRVATNEDAAAITDLIDRVYREYGDRVCLEGADQDLFDVEASYDRRGGRIVVLEGESGIVGSHAVLPLDSTNGLCTFRRLYVSREHRGSGAGERLMQWAIDWAKQQGLQRVEFWSDTRFERAHQFFSRLGFKKDGRVRDLDDGHEPYQEYFFWRAL